MTDMGYERSFKTVSQKLLLIININESMFFGTKTGQTKRKPLRRDLLRFSERN